MNLAHQVIIRAASGSISNLQVDSMLAEGGQLVDVRSPDDFRQGALPGARNLPIDALAYDYEWLDKSEPVILYGAQNASCVRAAQLLACKGFNSIYHLADPSV